MMKSRKIRTIMAIIAGSLIAAGICVQLFADEADDSLSPFEQAVAIIKKYETLHQPRHWPFVGYGHRILPGERFSRKKALGEQEADALLRKDLLANCARFRQYGADSLLLGTLAYNIGPGAVSRSSIVRRLNDGDREIRDIYLSHCRYRGKPHNGLRNRRIEEFEALFITDTIPPKVEVPNEITEM